MPEPPLNPPTVFAQLGAIIAESPTLRARMKLVADHVSARAAVIATEEGAHDVHIGRESGTTPGTHARYHARRMYERITAPTDQEWGTKYVKRRRILGRAVNSS